MKWILFLLALLVVGVPGFAQKVNPQEKKLVKSITTNKFSSVRPILYTFAYDDLGNLVSAQSKNDATEFLLQGKKIIASTNSSAHQSPSNIVVTTNDSNFITSIKDISNLLDGSGIAWKLYEFVYDYDYEMGNYTLNSCSSSTWFQFNGKQPEMAYSNQYDRWYYLYNYGKLQTNRCVETSLSDDVWFEIDKIYNYTNNYDDTSINLMFLINILTFGTPGNLCTLPLLTEWCPTTAIKLPKEYVWEKRRTGTKQTIYTYEYVYEGDNLTTILIHRMWRDEISSTTSINIEYYY